MTSKGDEAAHLVVTQRDDTAGGSHRRNVKSRYFLRGEQTGGAFSLTEILFQPGAQGTPMHIHTREEETYYVIEGKLLVHVDERDVVLGPGGSVVLPRNMKHKVTPASDKVTRALMILTPPGFEGMLMQLDQIKPGELDMAAVGKLWDDYGFQILPNE
jgi:mannose-6-phosphate isomerase-like protein (cupin superfamily)